MDVDWAYRDSLEQSRSSGKIRSSDNKSTRPRGRSILQTVALESHSKLASASPDRTNSNNIILEGDLLNGKSSYHSPPKAQVKPRAKSLHYSSRSRVKSNETYILYPFLQEEATKLLENDSNVKNDDLFLESNVLDDANRQKYLAFIESCRLTCTSCTNFISEADNIAQYLNELQLSFDFIEQETSSFEKDLNDLEDEKIRLKKLNENLQTHLDVFNSLDRATRLLNRPGSELVTKNSFKQLMISLDNGLEYTNREIKLRDMDLYRMRYRQCMTRALTLVQEYVCSELRSLQNSVQTQLSKSSTTVNRSAQAALLCTKFENEASTVKTLVHYISERATDDQEYTALYTECLKTYLGIRYRLLSPIISSDMEDLVRDSRDLVSVARSSFAFFRDTFTQEKTLFAKFFDDGEIEDDLFQTWLIDLSEPLYDSLRQKIIRESNISRLCELISVLLPFENEEENQDSSSNYELGPLFKPILYDVQSKLVFRVQTAIEQDIARYVPRDDDISGFSHRKGRTEQKKDVNFSDLDTVALLEDWYPPVKTSISLLSQMYQLVDSAIFDDLAHRIVHECIASLDKLHTLSLSRLGTLESWLFMIKNYLMLRAQIIEFDIHHTWTEVQVDFSEIQHVLSALRSEGINSSNLLKLAKASIPKMVNNMLDAKEELYAKLKNSIHQFTENAVGTIVQSITFKDRQLSELSKTAIEDTRELREAVTTEFPRLRKMIEIYIDDPRTIDILIDSIQDLVVQAYANYFHELIQSKVSAETLEGVMDPEGLASWLGDIVIKLHTYEEEIDDRSSVSGSGG